ncbi:MAG TPA: hypothetical protein VME41_14050 [Stellaceae bacterium]|nr:hypothetical protein [Stellaceae bacterium]
MAVRNVKLVADFWNFQLRWNENMRPENVRDGPLRLAWERVPSVVMGELPAIFGTSDPLAFKGISVFASIDPRSGSRDAGLKRYLHWLNTQTGFDVHVRDRRAKKDDCPHCGKDIDRMVEKGVDASVVNALYEGAINNSYDIAVLLSNDTDHIPAIRTVQDRLNKQIVHLAFKRGGDEVRTTTWSNLIMDGPISQRLIVQTA